MSNYKAIDDLVLCYKESRAFPEDSPERESGKVAGEMLVMTFKPLILAAISRSIVPEGQLEDAFQDGCLAFVQGLNQFDAGRGAAFNAFIQGYMKRYFMKWQEGRFNHSVIAAQSLDTPLPGSEGQTLADTLADDRLGQEAHFIESEEKKKNRVQLAEGLSRLSAQQRRVLRDHYAEGLSLSAIALRQGKSRQAIQDSHARAIKKLKKFF